jgi:TIR domain
MLLFLSYADEDGEIAREIADRLRSEHVSVYTPRDGAVPSGVTAADAERAIQQADAFLALLSPDSLTSASCRREREVALRRQRRGAIGRAGTDFVRVLQIRDTPYHQAGPLRSQPWFDLNGRAAKRRVICDLASAFASRGDPAPSDNHTAGGGSGQLRPPSPDFENRKEESDEVYYSLIKEHGERFWLLIASPQLGKSWLLDQIAERVREYGRWVVKLVDARDLPPGITGDADAILLMMLGKPRDRTGRADVRGIADGIIVKEEYHLCLLDSAELLDDSTIYRLRLHLGKINKEIDASGANARIALIAASRRDRGWKGVDPARLPQIQRLSEFSVGVVQRALEKLAGKTRRRITPDLHQHAKRMHEQSEGLPALLKGCLNWTRDHWGELDRLDDQDTFHEIAQPYVEEVLLSPDSLRGSGPMPTDEQQEAMRHAFRVLSVFRLFTGSHLSDLAERGELRDALTQVGWSADDLWNAVSAADLFYRSDKGIWMTIDRPIGRLLFRYWYPSEADRGRVNREALTFLQQFTPEQEGTDWARMLVECLWHEAQALILLGRSAELETSLTRLARDLSARLTPSGGFNQTNLRDYAVECTRKDPELWEVLRGVPGLASGLLDRVAEAVLYPEQEHP